MLERELHREEVALKSWKKRRARPLPGRHATLAQQRQQLLRRQTLTILSPGRLNEYQVIGRHLPTDTNPTPKL